MTKVFDPNQPSTRVLQLQNGAKLDDCYGLLEKILETLMKIEQNTAPPETAPN